MKIKKSLVSLAAASTVAIAGAPAALAETPAEDTTQTQSTTEGSLSDTTEDADSSNDESFTESVDSSFGWDEDTTGVDKFKDVLEIIGKIVGTLTGTGSLSS